MNFELTRIVTFATQQDLDKSLAVSSSSLSIGMFLSGLVGFLKANRLDDIERMVFEGTLDAHFPDFGAAQAAPRKWDDIEREDSSRLTQERYDRFLEGSGLPPAPARRGPRP